MASRGRVPAREGGAGASMEINPWEEQKAPVTPGPSGSCRRGSHRFMSDELEPPRVGSETVPALLCDTNEASVVLVTAAWFRGLLYDSLREAEGNRRGRRGTHIVFPGEVVRGKSLAAQGAAGPPHYRQPGQSLPWSEAHITGSLWKDARRPSRERRHLNVAVVSGQIRL